MHFLLASFCKYKPVYHWNTLTLKTGNQDLSGAFLINDNFLVRLIQRYDQKSIYDVFLLCQIEKKYKTETFELLIHSVIRN